MLAWLVGAIIASFAVRTMGDSSALPVWIWWLIYTTGIALGLGVAAELSTVIPRAILMFWQRWSGEHRFRRIRWTWPVLYFSIWPMRLFRPRSRFATLIYSQVAQHMELMSEWRTATWAYSLFSSSRRSDVRMRAFEGLLRVLAIKGDGKVLKMLFELAESQVAKELEQRGEPPTPSALKPLAGSLYARGLFAFRSANFAEAREWLDRTSAAQPDDVESIALQLWMAGIEGDTERGAKLLARLDAQRDRLVLEAEQFRERLAGLMKQAGREDMNADELLSRAMGNARWNAAWAAIRYHGMMRQPRPIEELVERDGVAAERYPRGRVEVRLARMIAGSLRKGGGNAVEKPYFELRWILRSQPVPPLAETEVPFWRALCLIHRGQFNAAIEKFDEMRALAAGHEPPSPGTGPLPPPVAPRGDDPEAPEESVDIGALSQTVSWRVPPILLAMANAYTAHGYARMGRPSMGEPFAKAAKSMLKEGETTLAILKLGPRDRLTPSVE